jgi:Phr family secreted Rap phosphatase inhibitor
MKKFNKISTSIAVLLIILIGFASYNILPTKDPEGLSLLLGILLEIFLVVCATVYIIYKITNWISKK